MTNSVKFLSICSGIEAASVAWAPLGWEAAAFSEIEPFPSAVLAHHYPDVPNLGDMLTLPERILAGEAPAPDLLCGGTPCQAFSVAGNRRSLDDARGNLSLTFCEIANAIDDVRARRGEPSCIVFWENVPGVLNTADNAFGCFLAGIAGEDVPLVAAGGKWTNAGCVYGPKRAVAWRVLDAQYFGVAQRRRRVFLVASARDGFDPSEILFEREGVRRDSAPSREARETTPTNFVPSVAHCLETTSHDYSRADGFNMIAEPVVMAPIPIHDQATRFAGKRGENQDGKGNGLGIGEPGAPMNTLTKGDRHAVLFNTAVRRLTVIECERLQGFPDDYTNIPWRKHPTSPDGPRYKALGNSWAVPNVRWIGARIDNYLKQLSGEQK